jgi:hypothetical protein
MLPTLTCIEFDQPDPAIRCFAKSEFCEVCAIAAGVDFIWRAELSKVQLLTVSDEIC